MQQTFYNYIHIIRISKTNVKKLLSPFISFFTKFIKMRTKYSYYKNISIYNSDSAKFYFFYVFVRINLFF